MLADCSEALPWSNAVALLGFFAMIALLGWIGTRVIK